MDKANYRQLLTRRFEQDDHGHYVLKGVDTTELETETSQCGEYLFLKDAGQVVFVFMRSDKGFKQQFELWSESGSNVCFSPNADTDGLKKAITSFYRIGFRFLLIP